MSIITGQQGQGDGQAQGSGAAGGAGNQAPTDWRTSLPEDIRSEKVFDSIKAKDLNEALPILAKNYVHAQRMVGADKVAIPGQNATPEEWNAFYSKIGRPEKPEDYALTLPQGLTEDKLDKARLDAWRKEMHEAGVPKKAAERIMARYLNEEFSLAQAQKAAREQTLQQHELALKQELGMKFDEKVNFARLALREFGSDDLSGILEETGLGSHPAVVKFFAQIGEKLADDRARGGVGSGGNPFGSPEAAQAELKSFNSNAENMKALFDKSHPNHDYVVEQRRKLFEAAYPKTAEA